MIISPSHNKGFTLIEFVVIMSIFAIVASIALFNFSGFSSNVSLTNLTHDVALVLRDAQAHGISNSNIANNNDIEDPIWRGVYFAYDNNNDIFEKEIILFDDANRDTKFEPSEEVDTIIMQSLDYISDIKVGSINPTGSCTEVGGVRIFFKRPEPTPIIYCGSSVKPFATIEISSADDTRQKYIELHPTGQISIQ